MRIGWLADDSPAVGGAELTQAEFRAAVPDGIEIVDCAPGYVEPGLDHYVVQNCVLYPPEDFFAIQGTPVTKYWHDVGPHLRPEVTGWLAKHATPVFCSPIQMAYMGATEGDCVPPPVDLARFQEAAARVNGDRKGVVSIAAWRNFGKAPHRVAEWANQNRQLVDFYGPGSFAPADSVEVAYDQMPEVLSHYKTFVFLPTVLEPFGRLVVEAWAAGCEVVTNGLVGAKWWIENQPEALDTAADDFWTVVTR